MSDQASSPPFTKAQWMAFFSIPNEGEFRMELDELRKEWNGVGRAVAQESYGSCRRCFGVTGCAGDGTCRMNKSKRRRIEKSTSPSFFL